MYLKGDRCMFEILKKKYEIYPDVCTCKEMCQILGNICTKTGYKLLKENRIPSFRIGTLYFILKEDILAFMCKQ